MVGPLPVGRWGPRYALGATCESVNALMNLSGSSPFNLINLSLSRRARALCRFISLSLSLSLPPSTHTPCLARLSLGASLGRLPRLAVRVGMLLNVPGSPAAFVDVVLYSYGLTGVPFFYCATFLASCSLRPSPRRSGLHLLSCLFTVIYLYTYRFNRNHVIP